MKPYIPLGICSEKVRHIKTQWMDGTRKWHYRRLCSSWLRRCGKNATICSQEEKEDRHIQQWQEGSGIMRAVLRCVFLITIAIFAYLTLTFVHYQSDRASCVCSFLSTTEQLMRLMNTYTEYAKRTLWVLEHLCLSEQPAITGCGFSWQWCLMKGYSKAIS